MNGWGGGGRVNYLTPGPTQCSDLWEGVQWVWDASGFSSGFYSVGGFPLLSQTFCTSALIWKGFADCYHPPFLGPPTSFHFCLQQPLNPILPILCSFCPPSPDWPLVSNHHPPQNFVFLGAIPSKFLQGRGLAVNYQYGPPAPPLPLCPD